jgi:hypothetical protein
MRIQPLAKKILSVVFIFTLVFSSVQFTAPQKAEAGIPTSLIGSAAGCGTLPLISKAVQALTNLVNSIFKLAKDEVNVKDQKLLDETRQASYVTNCLNGIAIGMAKLQLEKTTNKIVGWAKTGVNGNPLYVQDLDNLLDGLQQAVVEKETDLISKEVNAIQPKICIEHEDESAYAAECSGLGDQEGQERPAWCSEYESNSHVGDPNVCLKYGRAPVPDYPYGRDFAISAINLEKTKDDIVGGLRQDLTRYLDPNATIQSFSSDFSEGGWDAWLGLTQHPQNNPLGFTLTETQNIADQQARITQQKTDEINRNGGTQDQRKCLVWKKTTSSGVGASNGMTVPVEMPHTSQNCVQWEVVTPGSIIKDEISNTINSPTRQLELVRTLNESLIGFFESLLDQFNGPEGLGGVSLPLTNPFNDGLGISVDLDPNGNITTKLNEPNPGGTGSFDILRDLGNTYINGKIDHRGILQTQQDYSDQIKKVVGILPTVMPSLGALDYCIPGPTPAWETTAQESASTYTSQSTSQEEVDYWNGISTGLLPEYQSKIDALYGYDSPMQTATLENGQTNSSYLPMSSAGLTLVKDLPTYADTIAQKEEAYKESASQTNGSLYQLIAIKNKANAIIAAAQKRRTAARKASGQTPLKQTCLDDEKITYVVAGVRK